MLGLLESRAEVIDISALAAQRTLADGSSVKALWTPDVKKLILNIPPGLPSEEREGEGERKVEIIQREWVEQNRDFLEGEFIGGLRPDRIARITWKTPDETLVRFVLSEADDPDADPEGGPTPDVDWTENSRDEETDTEFGDRIERIVFDVPEVFNPVGPNTKVAFTYFRTDARKEEAPLSSLASGTVEWSELTRQVALIEVDGSSTQIERILTLTLQRRLFRDDVTTIFKVTFRYEEGIEGYEFPSEVTVIELPEVFLEE